MIEVPVPAYQPLPPRLTAPLALPPPPPRHCTDRAGKPAVCVLDALMQIPALRALLKIANQDRAAAARITRTPEATNGR